MRLVEESVGHGALSSCFRFHWPPVTGGATTTMDILRFASRGAAEVHSLAALAPGKGNRERSTSFADLSPQRGRQMRATRAGRSPGCDQTPPVMVPLPPPFGAFEVALFCRPEGAETGKPSAKPSSFPTTCDDRRRRAAQRPPPGHQGVRA